MFPIIRTLLRTLQFKCH